MLLRSGLCVALLVCLLVAASAAPEIGAGGMRFTNQTEMTVSGITGPGASQSTLTDSGAYANLLGLTLNSGSESNQLYFSMSGRATNDDRVDLKKFSLTSFQGRMCKGSNTVNFGDTFESFSQYGLSSALKGLSYRFHDESASTPDVTVTLGYAYPRWDNFYGGNDVEAIRRKAYGLNIKQDLSPVLSAGAHFSKSSDSNRVTNSDPLFDDRIYGLNWEFKPFEGLSVTGESSFSHTVESPEAGAAGKSYDGSAHRLAFAGEGGPVRLNMEYERVSPGFESVLGSSTPDREKFKMKWRRKNGDKTSVNYGFLWYRDNLSDQKAYTTRHFRPELGFTLKRLFGKQYASGDVDYKLDRKVGGGKASTDNYVDLGYRDRFGSVDADTRLGVTDYMSSGDVRNSREWTFNTSLSARRSYEKYVLRPTLYLGTWLLSDDLADTRERVYEFSVGTGYDLPGKNITSNIKIGSHKLLRTAGDDTSKLFLNLNVYYRPRRAEGAQERTIFLRAFLNDYNTTTHSRNFTETSVVTGIDMQY